ncbi:MAG: protein kinase domain-containing protein [Phycisphaerales bacterium]
MAGAFGFFGFIILLLVGIAAIVLLIMLLIPMTKGLFWLITAVFKAIGAVIVHFFRFIYGMIADALRFVGAVITALVFVPLVLANIVIGRWSASRHFGAALQDEIRTAGGCVYRIAIGHPARFLLLHSVTEGIEKRIPEALANAPGSDKPKSARSKFDGYTIVGSLAGGGSGAKLYIADPSPEKAAAFARNGAIEVDQVVIKSFSVHEGSSLPQIVRESRSLEAARKLGLVLDHELNDERFFYVMPYVPGDSLTVVANRLHGASGPTGLEGRRLRDAIGFVADLVHTLDRYHRGGLWHKDVKPDNIIVSSDARAHLVDLGLVTPLRSAMTLTTHGTEYFRDPEMVRMALRGAKVHEIDGGKVDVYGAGAVLYSVIENSFPAHGELSRLTKRCPEALRWVIRRSMAAMNKRYDTAADMLADLRAIQNAQDPFLLKPKDLPSMSGRSLEETTGFAGYDDKRDHAIHTPHTPHPAPAAAPAAVHAAAHSPAPRHPHAPHAPTPGPAPHPGAPIRIRLKNWWSGAFDTIPAHAQAPAHPHAHPAPPHRPRAPRPPINPDTLPSPTDYFAARDSVPAVGRAANRRNINHEPGRTAHAMLANAQKRVRAKQQAAAKRRRKANSARRRYNNNPNAGVIFAAFLFLAVIAGIVALVIPGARQVRHEIELGVNAAGAEGPVSPSISIAGITVTGPRTIASIDGQRIRIAPPVPFAPGATRETTFAGSDARDGIIGSIQHRVQNIRHGAQEIATILTGEPITSVSGPQIALSEDNATDPAANPDATTILLLNDHRLAAPNEQNDALADIVARLRDNGYEVLGLTAQPHEIEQLAKARKMIGTSGPQDAQAWARLQAWMSDPAAQNNTPDAILWIPNEADGPWRLVPDADLSITERTALMRTLVGQPDPPATTRPANTPAAPRLNGV